MHICLDFRLKFFENYGNYTPKSGKNFENPSNSKCRIKYRLKIGVYF